MADNLYSIIIPTRERADVLHFAIRTVLKLTRSNYELIVMDNCGSPETRQVVEAFASPNIRYFRSPRRLSMADNWERGLDQAAGDYITFLGDDDGIMPDALEVADRFHALWPDQILSWWPFTWSWPDFLVPDHRNLAQMYFGDHVERHNSRDFLRDVLAGRKDWTTLPTLYCSFVPRRMIEEIRSAHGRFFLAHLPDVSSGMTNLSSSKEFFCSYRPLSCWGLSRHSTGASQYFLVGETARQFDAERRDRRDEPWHPLTCGADLIVEVRIIDLYLRMKEKLFPNDRDLQIDMAALLGQVASRSATRFHSHWDEVKSAVEEMARRNGLDPDDFPVAGPARATLDRFAYTVMPDRKGVIRFSHFTDPTFIRTIEDFLEYAGRMCVPPSRVRIPERDAHPGSDRVGLTGMRGLFDRVRHRFRKMATPDERSGDPEPAPQIQ
jgi:glycosyltransferase involved in cell wall biosynthesis